MYIEDYNTYYDHFMTSTPSETKWSDKKQAYIEYAGQIMNEVNKQVTYTKPGSLTYLLHGRCPSPQSVNIKLGKHFEKWFKYIVEDSGFSILPSGITENVVRKKARDIDLLFKNDATKTLYYYELKANINLDTQKLPAVVHGINAVHRYLMNMYNEYTIKYGVLHWSVYNNHELTSIDHRKVNQFKKQKIQVINPSDLFNMLDIDFSHNDWNDMFKYMREINSQ